MLQAPLPRTGRGLSALSVSPAVLSKESSPWHHPHRGLGGRPGVQGQDANGGRQADLSAAVRTGGNAERLDQGQIRLTPISPSRSGQSGDGGGLGMFELQHSTVDSAALETATCGHTRWRGARSVGLNANQAQKGKNRQSRPRKKPAKRAEVG